MCLSPLTETHVVSHSPYFIVVSTTRRRWQAVSLTSRFCLITSPISSPPPEMSEKEAPFRPREKLIEKQKYFQSIHRHTYLKGPYDKITSVAIPVVLAATSLYMIGRGVYNLSHGIGKKE